MSAVVDNSRPASTGDMKQSLQQCPEEMTNEGQELAAGEGALGRKSQSEPTQHRVADILKDKLCMQEDSESSEFQYHRESRQAAFSPPLLMPPAAGKLMNGSASVGDSLSPGSASARDLRHHHLGMESSGPPGLDASSKVLRGILQGKEHMLHDSSSMSSKEVSAISKLLHQERELEGRYCRNGDFDMNDSEGDSLPCGSPGNMAFTDDSDAENNMNGANSPSSPLQYEDERLVADVVFPGGWVNRDGEPLPMIIRKADGGYNYSTSDLACIIDRVERLGCDGFLYVVGTPQKQHFEMVFQVAKKAGFMSHNHQAVHVNFGSVLDTDGKVLKSREGEVIKLHDLLEEAIRRAKQSIDDKNPDLLGKEREEVARAVGIGAVKYADLSTERTKDYIFDWEKMRSFEGNTAPYLQYAYARISSIFRKWGGDRESLTTNLESLMESELSNLRSEEILLSRRLVEFPSILDDSVSTFSPHKLCKHLHSIASSFASFYENCGILKEDDEAISRRRLALCEVTSRELKLGLEMMGINVPERM